MATIINYLIFFYLKNTCAKNLTESTNSEAEKSGPTFDDIKRRALGINASADDVVSLQGSFASEAGFGIGMGLGYSKG